MNLAKKILGISLALLVPILAVKELPAANGHGEHMQHGGQKQAAVISAENFPVMPDPGKKVALGNSGYLVYEFVKKPALGPVILKIKAFDLQGKHDPALTILVDAWMPSMPSMHKNDHETCRLSKNKEYLAPVNITMPGAWEIKVTVIRSDEVVFRGSHKFVV